MLTYIDNKTKIHTLILFFWAAFWLLNGGDKFFNGKFTHISNPNVTKGVLVNLKGEKTHELKGLVTSVLVLSNLVKEVFICSGASFSIAKILYLAVSITAYCDSAAFFNIKKVSI